MVADVAGQGETTSMAEFTAWTGYEANGIVTDPLFVDEVYPRLSTCGRFAGNRCR